MTQTINIARDYSSLPGGRYRDDGPGNGTAFREDFLVPALKKGGAVRVVLDGAAGYPSSFLEEAFGGLVRNDGLDPEAVLKALTFEANSPGVKRHVARIIEYIRHAEKSA